MQPGGASRRVSGAGAVEAALQDGGDRIKCYVRCRPPNDTELTDPGFHRGVEVVPHQNRVVVRSTRSGSEAEKDFHFDGVFPESVSQQEVFDTVASGVLEDTFSGYSTTIFCYGQTGTGKTFTMVGGDGENRGIFPRAMDSMFSTIHADQGSDYQISIQCLQIYMEMIQDLLNPSNQNMRIREDPKSGVFVSGLKMVPVHSADDVLRYFAMANSHRATALTQMNAESSRSHMCLIVHMERRQAITREDYESGEFTGMMGGSSPSMGRSVLNGKLNLVDLAGSERVRKTGASGTRLQEAKAINVSLSALGNVIQALTQKKVQHVPFRDSKLTRLLQDSLGGRGKTSIVVTIGPDIAQSHESYSSCLFGQRSMLVKINAIIHEDIDYKALSVRLQAQVDELGDQVRQYQLRDARASEEAVREYMAEADRRVQEAERQMETMRQSYEQQLQSVTHLVQGGTPQSTMVAMQVDAGRISKLEQEYELRIARLQVEHEQSMDDALRRMEEHVSDLERQLEEKSWQWEQEHKLRLEQKSDLDETSRLLVEQEDDYSFRTQELSEQIAWLDDQLTREVSARRQLCEYSGVAFENLHQRGEIPNHIRNTDLMYMAELERPGAGAACLSPDPLSVPIAMQDIPESRNRPSKDLRSPPPSLDPRRPLPSEWRSPAPEYSEYPPSESGRSPNPARYGPPVGRAPAASDVPVPSRSGAAVPPPLPPAPKPPLVVRESTLPPNIQPEALDTLLSMGFDREVSIQALSRCNGDPNLAVDVLFSGT